MAILSAENLAKSYKKRQVVSDVSLTVNSGEIVGLLGKTSVCCQCTIALKKA